MKRIKLILIALSVALLSSCSNYSAGERIGIITKFSYKGAIWETWEGELLQQGLITRQTKEGQTSTANIFEFSLDKDAKRGQNNNALRDSIQKAFDTGLPVKLKYHQESFTNCSGSRGETSYFVTEVKILY